MFDSQNCFGIRDVCKLWRINKVADRINVWLASSAIFVDHDKTTIINFHGSALESEFVGKWSTTDRHDYDIANNWVARGKCNLR